MKAVNRRTREVGLRYSMVQSGTKGEAVGMEANAREASEAREYAKGKLEGLIDMIDSENAAVV